MNAVFSLSTISKDARQNLLYGNASLKITYILFTLSVLQAKKYFNNKKSRFDSIKKKN